MRIGILAVQGAFVEHERMLAKAAVKMNQMIETVELRKKEDLQGNFDGFILPGGESTVQGKLLKELGMFDIMKTGIEAETPVFATCAGLILLAKSIVGDETVHFGTLPVAVKRNAYGRQLGSFETVEKFEDKDFEMIFIRAPYVESVSPEHADEVETLAVVEGKTVAVRYKNQIGLAFHPELGEDTRIHEEFIKLCMSK